MAASILCVIDFSASSRKALEWAVANARTHKSHLTVLYPYRLTRAQYGESAIAMRKKIEDEAQKNFGILEQDLLLDKKISYDFKTEVGFIADRVEEYTKNNPINFLVIDKNIRATNKESFDDLVENMQVPLVIIP
jgi:nucleotide-binding universal stress UspA family protein